MKILFLANNTVGLYRFRKELLKKLVSQDHDVYVSLPRDENIDDIEKLGCKVIKTDIDRRGVNPINDIKLLWQYKRIMNDVKPDFIFSYTIKPNIYGSMISNLLGYKQVCNITGTGATFLKTSFVSVIAKYLYKVSVKYSYKVFFQNSSDRDLFVKNGMVTNNWDMLPGSGCNLEEHKLVEMPSDEVIKFIFIGRVMQLKGIDEYLACAKAIKEKYENVKFYIAGWNEEEKYKEIVSEYEQKGYVEYLGFRKDIGDWIAKCHCTILPSHGGEGVPNVMLESAATGRVCIGSSIAGTVDVIEDGVTGYIFKSKDYKSLVEKVEKFIKLSFEEKKAMGLAGRKKVEAEFDRQIVVDKYMDELK